MIGKVQQASFGVLAEEPTLLLENHGPGAVLDDDTSSDIDDVSGHAGSLVVNGYDVYSEVRKFADLAGKARR